MADSISVAHLVITGVSTLFSGVIGGWIAAHKAGRNQQKIEDDIGHLQRDVSKAAAADWVKDRLDALHEKTSKAAGRDWVAAQIEGERQGRERIHRSLEGVVERLNTGDKRFDTQMIELTQTTARLESVADNLNAFDTALADLATKEHCGEAHKAVDRRLDGIEERERMTRRAN